MLVVLMVLVLRCDFVILVVCLLAGVAVDASLCGCVMVLSLSSWWVFRLLFMSVFCCCGCFGYCCLWWLVCWVVVGVCLRLVCVLLFALFGC